MKKVIARISIVLSLAMVLFVGAVVPSHAKAPVKESVKYLGSGKVEVEFRSDVDYKNVKVSVKDSSGKKYSAKIYNKDDDELKFKVSNFKKGKKYNFVISGVRKERSVKYGSVKGSFSIPKASISKDKAISLAKSHAIKKWNLSKSGFRKVEADSDSYKGSAVYEVSFDKGNYEYEIIVAKKNGKILRASREYDD